MQQSRTNQNEKQFNQSSTITMNGSRFKNSLLNRIQPQNHLHDTFSQITNNKSMRQQRQDIMFIRNINQELQFIAYCIVVKVSKTGMLSHQRLLTLDSYTKSLSYYSNIPHLPIKSIEEINQQPKQTINLNIQKRFSITQSKNGIGEIIITWIDSGNLITWDIKMGSNQIARDFRILVEKVRKGQHKLQIKQLMSSKHVSTPTNKVNVTLTPFLSSVQQLESKKNMPYSKKQLSLFVDKAPIQISKIDITQKFEQPTTQFQEMKIAQRQSQTVVIMPLTLNNNGVQEQNKVKVNESKNIKIKNYENVNQLSIERQVHQSSVKSIKIQQLLRVESEKYRQKLANLQSKPIINKGNEQNKLLINNKSIKIQQLLRVASEQYRQKHTNNQSKNIPINQKFQQNRRVSGLDRIIQQRRNVEMLESQSNVTIKQTNEKGNGLGMSKMMIGRKSTNKEEPKIPAKIATETKKQVKKQVEAKFYTSQKPFNTNQARQSILGERRFYESTNQTMNIRKKVNILDQHNLPRRQKSLSNSKDIKNLILINNHEKEWLFRWITSKDCYQRAQVYGKFVQFCQKKVQKLTSSYKNWHLFHKKAEQFIIKQDNIEFTYEMLSIGIQGCQSKQNEQNLISQMDNLKFMWRMINQTSIKNIKLAIPLACIINYKCIKVFCKVQMTSDKLLITQLKSRLSYKAQIQTLQQESKVNFDKCTIYMIQDRENQWLYFSELDIIPKIDTKRNITFNPAYIQRIAHGVIKNQQDIDLLFNQIVANTIPSFCETLNTSQLLSPYQLELLLREYDLNMSLLPLIYLVSANLSYTKAMKWILSQICAIISQQMIRENVHKILLTKNSNKQIHQIIHQVINRSLRWQNDQTYLHEQLYNILNVSLKQMADLIIDQYVICSLLMKLSIKCQLKQDIPLQLLEVNEYSFWNDFQFTKDSIQLTFMPQVSMYQYRYFNEKYDKLINCLDSNTNLSIIIESLCLKSVQNAHQSYLYKLLPLQYKFKVDEFIQNGQVSKQQMTQNTYFISKNSYQKFITLIKKQIKFQHYERAMGIILKLLQRVWVWTKSNFSLLLFLYEYHSMVNLLIKNEINCLSSCLKALQISIKFYNLGYFVTPEIVWQKLYKASKLHLKFQRRQQTINFYQNCQELFQKMMVESQELIKFKEEYIDVYTSLAELLLQWGRIDESASQIHLNFDKFDNWKKCLKDEQFIDKINSQKYQNYMLLFRSYQLLNKRFQLIKLMEQCSLQYIECSVNSSIQILSYNKFKAILRNMWYSIVLNCHSKFVTYNHYFSTSYSYLKKVSIEAAKRYIERIQTKRQGKYQFQVDIACRHIFDCIHHRLLAFKADKKQFSIGSFQKESILTILLIESLMELSNQSQQSPKSVKLQFLEYIICVLGYDYALGSIEIINQPSQF